MADFGPQSTTLSAPQGAGANVVKPATAGIDLGGVSNLVNIFAGTYQKKKQDEYDAAKLAAVQSYVDEANKINSAFAAGEITAREASVRQATVYRSSVGANTRFIEDIDKAAKALRGGTEMKEQEDVVASERRIQEEAEKQAVSRGFIFNSGMTQSQKDSQIRASQSEIRANATFADLQKREQAAREKGEYDRKAWEREQKDTSVRLLGQVAGDNLQAFVDLGTSLGNLVRTGKRDSQSAQADLERRFNDLKGSINALAPHAPEMANVWGKQFDEIYKYASKVISTKELADDEKNQVELIMARGKKLALSTQPSLMGTILANQWMPQNPAVINRSTQDAISLQSMFSTAQYKNGEYLPSLIGSPEEQNTLDLMKEALKDLNTGKFLTNEEKAKVNAATSMNNVLHQVGEIQNRPGAPAQTLSKVAAFIASPEFGKWAAGGNMDAEAQSAAWNSLQNVYTPTIINGLQAQLNRPLVKLQTVNRTQERPAASDIPGMRIPVDVSYQKEVPSNVLVKDMVDVQFTGNGIVFTPKKKEGLSIQEQSDAQGAVKALQGAQNAINQVIRMGAHLEGTTDYKAFWGANKELLLTGKLPTKPEGKKAPSDGSYAKESDLAAIIKGTDTGAGLTDSILSSLEKDVANMTPAQKAEFEDLKKKLGVK